MSAVCDGPTKRRCFEVFISARFSFLVVLFLFCLNVCMCNMPLLKYCVLQVHA